MKRRVLEVKAVEFDWIFSSRKGFSFIRHLSETSDLDLLADGLIKSIVQFMWSYYFWHIFVLLFIPYAIFLPLHILYITWLQGKTGSDWDFWKDAAMISIIVFVVYGLLMDLVTILKQLNPFKYFLNPW